MLNSLAAQDKAGMSQANDPLHSADPATLLHALQPEACDQIATLIVAMRRRNKLALRGTHSARSLSIPGRRGHILVPDIVDDLSTLSRHETGPAYSYRAVLRGISGRHGISDDGTGAPASVERELLRCYQPALRPDAAKFQDRGDDDLPRRIGYAVPGIGWGAYLMSPDWTVVTAVVLEIAAQRRIALTRAYRTSLEP